VAARHDLVIISDEIYRDLVYDTAPPFLSPANADFRSGKSAPVVWQSW